MAKGEAKFELTVGAVDQFSGPFRQFGGRVDEAADKVGHFGQVAAGLKKFWGRGLGADKLGGAFKGFAQGLGEVKNQALGLLGTVTKIGLAGVGAGAGLFGLVKTYADAGDEAAKMAQRAGITTQAWQEMAYAASLSDVSAEELLGSYSKLNKAAVEAAKGGKSQAATFKELGVTLKNNKGQLRATDELMLDVAGALAKMPDGAKKSALAMNVFGKSGAELLPFLNSGREGLMEARREAERLGLVFGDEAPKASEEFNDSLTRLGARAKGLAFIAGGALLPAAQGLVNTVTGLIDENRELIKVKIVEWAKKITDFLPKLKAGLSAVAAAIPGLAAKAGQLFDRLGGWGTAGKVAAGILGGPLAGSILGLVKPFGLLAGAITTTPLGIVLGLGAGFAALMAKAGVLEPFLAGVAEGFGGLSAGLSESFVGLLDSVAELFGIAGENLRDANGEINPEAWRQLGKSIGELTGGVLGTFVDMLREALGLLKDIGEWLGKTAGLAATGVDAGAMEKVVGERGALLAEMEAEKKANGGVLSPEKLKEYQKQNKNLNFKEDVAKGKANGAFLGRASGFDAIGYTAAYQPDSMKAALAASAAPALGPPALGPGAKANLVVQETKHTEIEKTEVNIKVQSVGDARATVTTTGLPANVGLTGGDSRVGVANSGG